MAQGQYKPLNGSSWIRKEKRLAIYIRDNFTCVYCGRALKGENPTELTLDHLVPRSSGGSNDATNLVLACRHCNSQRGDRAWVDYAPGGAQDRINTLRYLPLNIRLAKALIEGTAGDIAVEELR